MSAAAEVLCRECYDPYPIARYRLGYDVCLDCGDAAARQVNFCVVNLHKSNYTVISNREELKGLNKNAQT
jgi:hypothetical protein